MANKIRFISIVTYLTFLMVSCGTSDKLVKSRIVPFKDNFHAVVPIYIAPKLKDTIRFVYNDTPHVIPIRRPEKVLVKDGILPTYDTLLKEHLSLTQHYLRAVDSSRHRKKVADSALIVVKDLKNQFGEFRNAYDKNQNAAENYATDRELTKKEVIIGFSILLLFSIFNTVMHLRRNRIKKEHHVK